MTPYRESSPPSGASSRLVFRGKARDARNWPGVAAFQLFSIPAMAAAIVGSFFGTGAFLLAFVAAGAAIFVGWRRRSHGEVRVLSVMNGVLSVSATRQASESRLRIADVGDVVLDSKSIRPLQESPAITAVARGVESRVGPEIDISRVVIVTTDGTEIRIGEKYLSNSEATEWLGKIRVFLRKQGWVPEDERA